MKLKPTARQQRQTLHPINNEKALQSPRHAEKLVHQQLPIPSPMHCEVKEDQEQIMLLLEKQQVVASTYPCGLCAQEFPSKLELISHFYICCQSMLELAPPPSLCTPQSLPSGISIISQQEQNPNQKYNFFYSAGLNLRSAPPILLRSCAHHQSLAIVNTQPSLQNIDIDAEDLESACISPDSELFWRPMLAAAQLGVTSELGCRVPGLFPRQIIDPHGYEKFCPAAPGHRFPAGAASSSSATAGGGSRLDRLRLSNRYCHFWSYQGCKSRVLRARREKQLTTIINRRQRNKDPVKSRPRLLADRPPRQSPVVEAVMKDCSVALVRLPDTPEGLGLKPCSVVLERIRLPLSDCQIALTRIDLADKAVVNVNKDESVCEGLSPARATSASRRSHQLASIDGWQVDLWPISDDRLANQCPTMRLFH